MVPALTNWKLETGNWKLQRGFTLIELLIAIAIIAILTSIPLTVSYANAQRKANDARRRSDIKQYQPALEAYGNANNGAYPAVTGRAQAVLCTTTYLQGKFLASCPEDPKYVTGSTATYNYSSDGSKYVLWAQLEIKEGNPPVAVSWVVCSDGRTETKAPQVSSVSGGSCPL